MMYSRRLSAAAAIAIGFPLCLVLAAGCSPSADNGNASAPPPGGAAPGGSSARMGGGGPGGPGGGRMGGRGTPVAENASGKDILQAKCGCHGPDGKGGRAPALTGGAGKSESDLVSIITDGKGRMPSFKGQLSEAQIKKVAAHLKELK